jgi:GTP cyclohydrolase I
VSRGPEEEACVRPIRLIEPQTHKDEAAVEGEIAGVVGRLLELLGEDVGREGLRRTPLRVARSLRWLTDGNRRSSGEAFGSGVFTEASQGLVVVHDVEFHSLCEHHLLPFSGRVHVGYLPAGRIVGLSKIPRLIGLLARKLQVQERLTDEIADTLAERLAPRGVGVVIEAQHLCMMMRGVRTQGARTTTSAFRGSLATDAGLRTEFLASVR